MVRADAIGQNEGRIVFLSGVTPSNRFHSKKRAKFYEALMHIMMPGVVKDVRDVLEGWSYGKQNEEES